MVIKTNGATPSRIYRRQDGTDTDVIDIISNSRSTKALIKDDIGGRIVYKDSN